MKNTLEDLNNYLFESLERLMDDDLSDEEFEREVRRSERVTAISKTVIQNGELVLRAMKHAEEFGLSGGKGTERRMPHMLETTNAKEDAS